MFNINTNHPLIQRQQTYNLNKKILTIHSEDRDTTKWKFSNHFSIECPEIYQNVETIRVIDTCFPSSQFIFNNDYQNTKMVFTLYPETDSSDWHAALGLNVNGIYTVEINEGNYTTEQLAIELENKMNKAVNDYLSSAPGGPYPPYLNFKVYYDPINISLYFGNLNDSFTLKCGTEVSYTLKQCEQPNVFKQATHWGLPWHLGFGKTNYVSNKLVDTDGSQPVIMYHIPYGSPNYVWMPVGTTTDPTFYLKAPFSLKLVGDNVMYMEIEKYNYLDELVPYVTNTSSSYNNINNYGGSVNSAFAKIPIIENHYSYSFDSISTLLNNCGYFLPPIEKIPRLKFKFRYHDGRLVDFKDMPFNFSLEINQIRNDMDRNYSIKTPTFHN
jgi:hypothetical protein